MPMHTNYGDHLSVTVTRLRKGQPTETVLWSVQQRLYDEILAELEEDPHQRVGFGLCARVDRALESSLDHARQVTAAADALTERLRMDKALGLGHASVYTQGALREYERLTNVVPS
jgi:hypothetical protein